MAYWAKIDKNSVVIDCIVADETFITSGAVGDPEVWIEFVKPSECGSDVPAGKMAGVGSLYDPEHKVFYNPKPFASWTLDKKTWSWNPPIPYPDPNKFFAWDEENQKWLSAKDCCNGEYQDIHK